MRVQIIRNPNGGENSATDGDMDVAYALYTAGELWGEPAYRTAASKVCAALLLSCFNHNTHVSYPFIQPV